MTRTSKSWRTSRVMNLGWAVRILERSQVRGVVGITRPSQIRGGRKLLMKILRGGRNMKTRAMVRSRSCYWIFKLTENKHSSFHKLKDPWQLLTISKRCAKALSTKAWLLSGSLPLEAVSQWWKNLSLKWLRAIRGKSRRFLEHKEIKRFWSMISIKHQLLSIQLI